MSKMKSSGKVHFTIVGLQELEAIVTMSGCRLKECITIFGHPPEGMYCYVQMAIRRNVSLCLAGHLKECIAMFGWPPEGMYRYVRMAT
jgi:hypothetical protein